MFALVRIGAPAGGCGAGPRLFQQMSFDKARASLIERVGESAACSVCAIVTPMFDELALSHARAEACRRLAHITENPARKALWIERAQHWEELAAKPAMEPQRRNPPEVERRSPLPYPHRCSLSGLLFFRTRTLLAESAP